ncbi:Hypothetical protein ETEE_2996 [Edwardsiella anguillarum ET080813]|uniref:Uncharacterized protein n=1 Tax=Edwardsiella anguillarum ET080813 TaxID=667120 RepID=A0A076LLR2_9GAMM|nr:Hypothetical protein ETEE_2996 [Edwardsiella anguillarum ET080813]
MTILIFDHFDIIFIKSFQFVNIHAVACRWMSLYSSLL